MFTLAKMSRQICWYLLVLCTICCIFISTPSYSATSRHALVIGNSEYGGRFSLVNPLRDSTAIANKLASIGYKVHGNGPLIEITGTNTPVLNQWVRGLKEWET